MVIFRSCRYPRSPTLDSRSRPTTPSPPSSLQGSFIVQQPLGPPLAATSTLGEVVLLLNEALTLEKEIFQRPIEIQSIRTYIYLTYIKQHACLIFIYAFSARVLPIDPPSTPPDDGRTVTDTALQVERDTRRAEQNKGRATQRRTYQRRTELRHPHQRWS